MPPTKTSIAKLFPNWRCCSNYSESGCWLKFVVSGDNSFVSGLIDLIDNEVVSTQPDLDQFLQVAITALNDIAQAENMYQDDKEILHQLQFVRFYLATKASDFALACGRYPPARDWLLAGICKGSFKQSESLIPIVYSFDAWRLADFIKSIHPTVKEVGLIAVLQWSKNLFYYSRKQGTLVDLLLEDIAMKSTENQPITLFNFLEGAVLRHLVNDSRKVRELSTEATCQMVTWSLTYMVPFAEKLMSALKELYDHPTVTSAMKSVIGVTLSGCGDILGSKETACWAVRTINDCAEDLREHEMIQLLSRNAK